MNIQLSKISGTPVGGIYFNKPDGTLGQTVVSQIKLEGLAVGDKLLVNGATTVSCLQNSSVSYPGFHVNAFTASSLLMDRSEQGWWWVQSPTTTPLSHQHGQDIQDGSSGSVMQPYYNHDQTGMHEIVPGQEGDWWVAFVVWCSSSGATGDSVAKNEYLWVIPQQTTLSIMRFGNGQ